jgi:hypothetical protein
MTTEKEPRSAIELQIVENLRRVYNQKLEEDVPDRLLDLLRQLREKDPGNDQTGSGR